jgi:hypothetical protein
MADEEKEEQWAVYSDDEGTGGADDVAGGADISATAPNGTPAVSGINEAAQRPPY